MYKQFFFYIVLILIVLTLPVNTTAFFTKSHEYVTIKSFQEIDSPITQLCKDKLDIVLDGNTAADVAVLHYFADKGTDNFMSYISTHTRQSGYESCFDYAGVDVDLQCFCYGIGLHITQDEESHLEGGLTPLYIKKFYSSNYIGHMQVESDFEKKHLKLLESTNDKVLKDGTLEYYDSIVLDNLFKDQKYLNLMQKISKIDMRNDANIFANGYKGKGFYNTVYNKPFNLPMWFWGVSIGSLVIGFILVLLFLILRIRGTMNNWAFMLMIIYLLLMIFGATVLISMMTHDTWRITRAVIQVVPIRVAQSDVVLYNDKLLLDTKNFLSTGVLEADDASGLSYRDRSGVWKEGALNQAEKAFNTVFFPLMIILFILYNLLFIYLGFTNTPNIFRNLMKIFGWIFTIGFLSLLFFMLFIGFIM